MEGRRPLNFGLIFTIFVLAERAGRALNSATFFIEQTVSIRYHFRCNYPKQKYEIDR